jgi:hypothetical protein
MTKSDRLKKIEMELEDLEQWQKLGLVPKNDFQKHLEEINTAKLKISEERERLKFLRESAADNPIAPPPKKNTRTGSYADGQNLPDIDNNEEAAGLTDVTGFDSETASIETESTATETEVDEEVTVVEEEDDPFSDKNRWKRGIADPESEDW